MQEMTEIIPGLQGDIPANSQKGVPYVGGKYELYDNNIFFFFCEDREARTLKHNFIIGWVILWELCSIVLCLICTFFSFLKANTGWHINATGLWLLQQSSNLSTQTPTYK